MTLKEKSRRDFIKTSGSIISSTWIAVNLPAMIAAANFACQAKETGASFEVLTAAEAVELEAITSQIIPSDGTPGAKEAGIIYFIDRALGTFSAEDADPIRQGLTELDATVKEKHTGSSLFSTLTSDQQIDILKEIEESDFFGTVRNLTVSGTFSMPSYGGNQNKIGWNTLGFDDSRSWRPPFGYYDEQYTQQEGRNGR